MFRCQPGYQGTHCETSCPESTYGPQCSGTCQCKNNSTCSKQDGSCDCSAGWMGLLCDTPCPTKYYGKNCARKCHCQNQGSCDRMDGKCSCFDEWQGESCDLSMYLKIYIHRIYWAQTFLLNRIDLRISSLSSGPN